MPEDIPLHKRFSVRVYMTDQKDAPKGEEIAVVYLAGCIGGIIKGTYENNAFHYSPLETNDIRTCIENHAADASEVVFFLQGEYNLDEHGNPVFLEKSRHPDNRLKPTLDFLKAHSIPYRLLFYGNPIQAKNPHFGVGYIDGNDRIHLDGLQRSP